MAAAAGLAALAVLLAPWWGAPMDDAFISFRYASQWAAGQGLVFNAGERVEGFSDPLWIALLALAVRAGADVVRAAQGLGVACAVAAVALVARRLRGRGAWAAFGAVAAAVQPTLLVWAGRGLAGPMFCALVLGANVALEDGHRDGRPRAGLFACAAALALTRPEGVAWAALLVALAFPWGRPASTRRWATGAGALMSVLAAGVAARWAYYGALVPNTYRAKMTGVAGRLAHGVSYAADFAASPTGAVTLLGLALAAVLAVRRGRATPGPVRRLAAQVVVGVAMVVWMGGDWMPAHRFLVQVAVLGAVLVAECAAAWWPSPKGLHVVAACALAAALGAAPLAWGRLPADLDFYRAQVRTYERVGLWLAAHAPPTSSVACDAIGAVGLRSGLRIVDFYGLVDPAIAALPAAHPERPAGHQKYDVGRSLARDPDYVLLNAALLFDRPVRTFAALQALYPDGWLYGEIVRHPRVLERYEVVNVPVGRGWLPMLARRDAPR